MEVPPNIIINATIKAGSVYKFPDQALTSPEPHFFIVLNHNPIDDHLLILVCSSTKLAKTKWHNRLLPPATLVDIMESEYEDFTEDSIVNCNNVFPKSKQELISKLTENKLELKSVMSPAIVQKLRDGVIASPNISPSLKRILQQ